MFHKFLQEEFSWHFFYYIVIIIIFCVPFLACNLISDIPKLFQSMWLLK